MQKFEKSDEKRLCPCCGGKLDGRWENISKGIAQDLIKLRERVLLTKENKVHPVRDLNLTHSQYNNLQKLRFHGLIAHYKNPETKKEESGFWLLTKRGNLFCKNQISIPKKVLVFRNRIQDKGDKLVNMAQILSPKNTEPYWYQKEDYEKEIVFLDILDADELKIDINGQGKLF